MDKKQDEEQMQEDIDQIIEKYVTAGKILSQVREKTARQVTVGANLYDVARFGEDMIREQGGEPAFPINISCNEEAAHATPKKDDTAVFGEDMVKLDIGVHVDGFIADTAKTVDLSGNPELVEAAEAALEAAIKAIHAGINTAELGLIINDTITGFGYKPVANLTGHGLAQYMQHVPPSIPNIPIDKGVALEVGQVVAIEPFATNGQGYVTEGASTEIYHIVGTRPIRAPAARVLLKEVEAYQTLPFAKRWLSSKHLDFALLQLEKNGNISSYPVLKEEKGALVSQAEHTVIVEEDGCKVITR
ncbi:MAG: type II methionyl aminopeptidase [ANME-2 cluster archaeon]|nr:type II methionyl aminopeptidase [ANME-2 cluster archaeon]MDF1532110.1 type II methionyl aminopeptidase [ANME-2 cluster archaeon]